MMHTESGQLKPAAPFDFGKSLEAIWYFNQLQHDPLVAPDKIVKAVIINGQVIGFELKSLGTISEPLIEYTLFSERPLTESLVDIMTDRISFFLSLEDDLKAFYDIGLQDKAFAPVINRFYGYHPVKFVTPFEAACWSLLSQRSLVPIALRMRQCLVEKYGGSIQIDQTMHWAFPEPKVIAKASEADLTECLREPKKAIQILAIAQAFQNVGESFLRWSDYNVLEQWLLQVKGIGLSSASMIMIQGLGRMDKAPLTDKKLLATVKKVYGNPVEREMLYTTAAQYGLWEGYWAQYLALLAAK